MAELEYARLITKSSTGEPTIPPSADHDNGDWDATDVYEFELYVDDSTGYLYVRHGSDIKRVSVPDGFVDKTQTIPEVVITNITAENNKNYHSTVTCTIADPLSPAEGRGFTVFVRNGSATVGGVAYTAGSLIYRVYHSGAWATRIIVTGDYILPKVDGSPSQVLQTNGAGIVSWATISTGITVGTTPVTSGTDGRVFFQSGGVVQQSGNLTFDGGAQLYVGSTSIGNVRTSSDSISGVPSGGLTTYSVNNFPQVKLTGSFSSTYIDGRVGLYRGNTEMIAIQADSTGGYISGASHFNIGYGINSASGARLDVKAQGALSTDIAFRVRNSGDTANLFNVNGLGCVWANGKNTLPFNTAFGQNALSSITTGDANAAFGQNALKDCSSGALNSAFGGAALISLTNGESNTAVGYDTLKTVTSSSRNTGVGVGALFQVSTGFGRNTGVGYGSGSSISTGQGNTFMGYSSGLGTTTGNYNLHISQEGSSSGITSGQYNTFIGVVGSISNVSNNIIIADGQANRALTKDANHNVYTGANSALAPTATDGFFYIPTCAGTPTGVPTSITGKVPIIADTTNNKLYVYLGGAWVAMN